MAVVPAAWLPQGFLRGPDIRTWKPEFCVLSKVNLARSGVGLRTGSEGVKVSIRGNVMFPLKRLELSVPRLLCAQSMAHLRNPVSLSCNAA